MFWVELSVLALLAVIAGLVVKAKLKKDRLLKKYGDAEVVRKIIERGVWPGQTKEQLLDSLGKPYAVEQGGLHSSERWKYKGIGGNRNGLEITLENGIVKHANQI